MRLPVSLFILVAVAIGGFWWWLGKPGGMPPAPLAAGEKLHCVSYSPFRRGETPLDLTTRVAPAFIDDDLARLSKLTDCVRTYSTDFGMDRIAEFAQRHGLKVMQGIWLGRDQARNRREIEVVVGLAKRYPDVIRSIVAGNEALLRGEISGTDLASLIRSIKAQVSVPVTYADVWEFWLRHREVFEAVDFVTIHILPYWEDFPIPARLAADHVASIRRRVAHAYPGKEILIGEVGWPSAGRMREGALPSPATQARVMHDLLAIAKRENFRVNVIEAFDQPWKEHHEGTVGGHWGFLDADTREFKFTWGSSVSDHPYWRMQAVAGIILSAFVFGAAAGARRHASSTEPRTRIWVGTAIVALISGSLIGWAIENVPIESLGFGGWTRSLALAVVAILAPIAGSAALMRGVRPAQFAHILGPRKGWPDAWLPVCLGGLLIVLTVLSIQVALGLVFDPRYKDFPFAPLTAATIPFLVIGLIGSVKPADELPALREKPVRGKAEILGAAVLALSAGYIALNESLANWQALWLSGVLLCLALSLLRAPAPAAQSPG